MMQLECTSYLGTTINPHNSRLTSGGSSGGEGALIGFKGSPLGIGTDVGGSIRCPAAQWIFGFKPSAGRVPYEGDGLELYIKLIVDSEPWRRDPSTCSAVGARDSFRLALAKHWQAAEIDVVRYV
ncbi:hypothetical protein CspHIS471_0404150 [Cutaneotrichosporon sp. HIS471]|nr:hypothetical protein CspHIS471_0404150 [Cutaneotrichosporon sp. HIS471]